MTFEEGDGEASQPAQIVAQRSFAGAAVVFTKVHVQHPMHRLDAPMATDRFSKPFAAEIACSKVVSHFVRLRAVVMLSEAKSVADCFHPGPILFGAEIARRLREKIGAFVLA